MRVLFLGSGAFGLPTLDALMAGHELVGAVTQPDRPAGRGGATTPTPVAQRVAERAPHAEVLKPERIGAPDATARVRELASDADAWVVIAYGQKLPAQLLEGVFAVNLHASLLPRWRGAAPINAAIVAGDETTGVSVITLADRMDAGEVLGSAKTTIGPEETAGQLHDRLAEMGPAVIERVLGAHAEGTLEPQTQDESLVTLAPKMSKAEGWVDFSKRASECRARINGLSPWPGVTATLRLGDADLPLKLTRAAPATREEHERANAAPGQVTDPETGAIATGAGAVRLLEVQPPGKRTMAFGDFARGRGVTTDAVFAPPERGA